MEFEWEPRKAAVNFEKHGVSFAEAATTLADPLSITYYDPKHSYDEDRYITIGTSTEDRVLIVSHADRGDRNRIISARKVTPRERKMYENG